jgi:hypothetical protein
MKKSIIGIMSLFFVFCFVSQANAQHVVRSGDTMSKISKKYDMNLKDLIELNPHIENPNLIQPNDYIIIRSHNQKAKDLTDYARSLQDITAYSYGGQDFPYFTDCSGWAQGVYKKFGVNLPRVSRDQAKVGQHVTFQELEIGDLMFFSTRDDKVITHTGIYLGNNFWISNLNEKKDVEILSNWGTWTQNYFLWGARHKL